MHSNPINWINGFNIDSWPKHKATTAYTLLLCGSNLLSSSWTSSSPPSPSSSDESSASCCCLPGGWSVLSAPAGGWVGGSGGTSAERRWGSVGVAVGGGGWLIGLLVVLVDCRRWSAAADDRGWLSGCRVFWRRPRVAVGFGAVGDTFASRHLLARYYSRLCLLLACLGSDPGPALRRKGLALIAAFVAAFCLEAVEGEGSTFRSPAI